MSLFSFGKNKVKQEATEEDRLKEEKKQLKVMVEEMVEGLTKPYSVQSIQRSIKDQIDKKRYANPSKDHYKYSLLKNVIYFLEVEKEIKRTLSSLLRGEKFDSVPALDQHILSFQSRIRHSMDELLTANHDKYYHKYLATEEGINGLEREFIDHSVLHSWYIDACFYLQSKPMKDLPESVPKRWIVSEIERTFMWKLSQYLYLHNYEGTKGELK
ncbi:hypothetical protein [Jeotgalibacillus campisalis]|uniref:Uncharacterized protein n=1 Tax=Jeotgalibacillus campisalis TaxID=220754 RepID=A0A0C2VET2_9BACL|nr:hypothetical protein [Jeotgalibacillus campisalis]KIL43016.1 hypothetical protein KR50_34190 [Jeotgalibacillus campisalis]